MQETGTEFNLGPVELVTYEGVRHLKAQMNRERVTLSPGGEYLCIRQGDAVIGVVGLIYLSPGKVRFRSDYVVPAFRNGGLYDRLFRARMAAVQNGAHTALTAFCTQKSLSTYLRYGFRSVKAQNNGITFVRRDPS